MTVILTLQSLSVVSKNYFTGLHVCFVSFFLFSVTVTEPVPRGLLSLIVKPSDNNYQNFLRPNKQTKNNLKMSNLL